MSNRANFFTNWIDSGLPKLFWVNAFFIPHSFFTAIIQNHSRKHSIPAENLAFSIKVREDGLGEEEIEEAPEDGVYIHGLHIEGARWDSENSCLASPNLRKTYEKLPIIHLVPYVK